MTKDLTEALHQLTQAAAGQTTPQDKVLPPDRQLPPIPPRSGTGNPVASPSSAKPNGTNNLAGDTLT